MKTPEEILKEKLSKSDLRFSKKQTALIIDAMYDFMNIAHEPTEINQIINLINEYFSVNCISNNRNGQVVKARQLAIHFIKLYLNLSITSIGKIFNKHHATILHSLNTVNNRSITNKKYRMQMEDVDFKIKNMLYGND